MLKKNYLRPGLEWVYKLFFVVQSICMYASVATIAFTVLMRELFRVSIVWGYEIACWFVIILVFTSMPYNLYHKTNIGVTFVYDISPKVVKKIFSVIHFFVELACLIMMASGFKIWLTKVGMGTMVASGFTNLAYYGGAYGLRHRLRRPRHRHRPLSGRAFRRSYRPVCKERH